MTKSEIAGITRANEGHAGHFLEYPGPDLCAEEHVTEH